MASMAAHARRYADAPYSTEPLAVLSHCRVDRRCAPPRTEQTERLAHGVIELLGHNVPRVLT